VTIGSPYRVALPFSLLLFLQSPFSVGNETSSKKPTKLKQLKTKHFMPSFRKPGLEEIATTYGVFQ
jgi:hypothetical protein